RRGPRRGRPPGRGPGAVRPGGGDPRAPGAGPARRCRIPLSPESGPGEPGTPAAEDRSSRGGAVGRAGGGAPPGPGARAPPLPPPGYGTGRSGGSLELTIVRAAAGRPAEALVNLRKAEPLIERLPDVAPGTLYTLACAYAQYSTAARRSAEDLTPAERAECEAYADRAMAALRRAVAAGFSHVGPMRRGPDLDPLRPRRDFPGLLLAPAFPAPPV